MVNIMSVQTLPYNSTKQLTKHINAQELRCKCGGTENIKYNMDLLNKVEKLNDEDRGGFGSTGTK